MKRRDEQVENGSVVFWSRRHEDGRYASGGVRYRVPVRCGACGQVREVSASRARRSGFTGLCRACANAQTSRARMTTEDKQLASGSVVFWSRRYRDGRFAGGDIRYRVPVHCGACGQVREVSASRACRSGFTGLCPACASAQTGRAKMTTEDEQLASDSVVFWSRRYRDGRFAGGKARYRVPVRCGVCGQVREVSANMARRSDLTGLCPVCAGNEKVCISKETLVHLYHDEGLSLPEISDRLGCGAATVLSRMEEYGIERRLPGSVPQVLVPEEVLRRWSPELAYVAGMITADGSLERGRNEVGFYSTDYQWIEVYLALLQINAPVHEKPLESGKTLYTVEFSDPNYRAFLERIGLTPAKSTERTLGPLNVPDTFFCDFLRACIDGDGGIYSYPRKSKDYFTLRARLYSSCRPFLAWAREMVKRLIGLEATGLYCSKPNGVLWVLVYGGFRARQLLEWIYYAPDLPCLERKRAVWERYVHSRSHRQNPG